MKVLLKHWLGFEVIFDLDQREQELEKIEKTMAKSNFWQRNQDEISAITQERALNKDIIDQWQKLYSGIEDAKILAQMAFEEDDDATYQEVEKDILALEKEIRSARR